MAGAGGLAEQVRAGLEQEMEEQNSSLSSERSQMQVNQEPDAQFKSVRLSLLPPVGGGVATKASTVKDPLDELWFNKPIRRHVLEFAQVFAIIGLVVGSWIAYRGGSLVTVGILAAVAGVLLVLGHKAPAHLRPIWAGWMKFAMVLGHVMTFIILSIMWWLVLVPIAGLLKLIGKDVMDLSYAAKRESYWEDRKPGKDDFLLLERQY